MKKLFIITILLIIVVIFFIFFGLFKKQDVNDYSFQDSGSVDLYIIDGDSVESFSLETSNEITVFELLETATKNLGLILKTKQYDVGIFVEAIGDRENGQEGKYWLYYINEEIPMGASDKNKIKPGDKVEFKFEESVF